MNPERLIQKGRQAELKVLKLDLVLKIEANLRAAKVLLAMVGISPVEKVDIGGAAQQLNEANELKRELNEVLTELKTIDEALA